jgi:hypothetical protein
VSMRGLPKNRALWLKFCLGGAPASVGARAFALRSDAEATVAATTL